MFEDDEETQAELVEFLALIKFAPEEVLLWLISMLAEEVETRHHG